MHRRVYFHDYRRIGAPTKIAFLLLWLLFLLGVGIAKGNTVTPATCYPNCVFDQAWVDWIQKPATAETYTGDSSTLAKWEADVFGPAQTGEIDISMMYLAFSQNPDEPLDVTRFATDIMADAWVGMTDQAPAAHYPITKHVNWDPFTMTDPPDDPSPTPEPATIAMIGPGLLFLSWWLRRMGRNRATLAQDASEAGRTA